MLTVATKSKVILNLIQNVPGIMSKKAVKDLATNPKNNLLGYEDASAAISCIEMNDASKKKVEEAEDSTKLADLFPNPRLAAELEIIKETDRTKYKCFKDKMLELNSIAKEIDEAAGRSLDLNIHVSKDASGKLIYTQI